MKRRDWIKQNGLVGAGLLLAPQLSFGSQLPGSDLVVRPLWDRAASPIEHSWAGLGNIDQARWAVRGDMQEQLDICRKEIGLRHLRMANIFEEQLWVYDVDPAKSMSPQGGKKRINWRNPFSIYDSLLARNINPVVGTYYMPKVFASGTSTCYQTTTNITPPKDLKEWGSFIQDFTKHLVDRYGVGTVRNWFFEVWNEPNLKDYYSGMENYWQLYRTAYNAIKSVDASLQVGGPSTAHSAYLGEMLAFGAKNNCPPDFLIGHIYNNDSASGDPLSPYEGPQIDRENKSPNYISAVARGVRKLLTEASFKGQYHMNEWGLSWYPYRAERETPNEAAYIVKTMKEVSQMCDHFAYWALSDIYVECGFGREAFHGNYGMLSLDGLKKPSYFAHQLLSKLGDVRIPVVDDGDNQTAAFVTKKGESIRAIVYSFDINFTMDSSSGRKQVAFHLPPKTLAKTARIVRVDSSENNILKTWKDMGQPPYPKKDELAFLKARNGLKESGPLNVVKDSAGPRLLFEMKTPGLVYLEID